MTNSANRYFIVSYNTEFDRVNYPIILTYQEISDADELKKIILEMRGKIDLSKGQNVSTSALGEDKTELEYLRAENEKLRQKIVYLESQNNYNKMGDNKLSAVEKENLYVKISRLEKEKEELLVEQKEEIIILCQKIEQLNTEVATKNKELSDIKKGKGVRSYASGNIKSLTKEIETIKRELETHKRKNETLLKNNRNLENELRDLKRKMAVHKNTNMNRQMLNERSVKNKAFSIKSSSSTVNQQKTSNLRKNPSQAKSKPNIPSNNKPSYNNRNPTRSGNVLPNRNYIAMNNNFLKRSQSQQSRQSNSKLSSLNASQNSRKSFGSFVSKDSKLSKAPSVSKKIYGTKKSNRNIVVEDSFEKRKKRFEEIKKRNTNNGMTGNIIGNRKGSNIGKMKMEKFKTISNRLIELDKMKNN